MTSYFPTDNNQIIFEANTIEGNNYLVNDVPFSSGPTGATGPAGPAQISVLNINCDYSNGETGYTEVALQIVPSTLDLSVVKCATYVTGGTGTIRVLDVTNTNIIMDREVTNTDVEILTFGSLTNLPVNESLFLIEMKMQDVGHTGYIRNIVLE
jgi:hypothetical protein